MSPGFDDLRSALADRYEIEREIGEGGMATVYLAHDLKHERQVAIKVLKPELAAVIGADRFLGEIKTTANLQHPHILPLFDSGEANGFLYYVMPFVDGETLRDRLAREKQLPVDEAVQLTVAVASALDYAHERDILHRDIKPENILIHAGQPLIADFGIALAISEAGGGRLTETGLSLGTPKYMSPEQATADRELSASSDVYSLACVLYEMLAGETPHSGPTAQAILMKVLTEDARPVTELRKTVPTHVAMSLVRALERLPADRFAGAQQFADALSGRELVMKPLPADRRPASSEPARRWGLVHIVVAAALIVVGLVLGRLMGGPAQPDLHQVRFVVDLPAGRVLAPSDLSPIALSPDGRRLVFVGDGPAGTQLYLRELEALEIGLVSGTEGAMGPFFSPDGEWVGFFADGKLKKVPVAGGRPVILGDAPLARGAMWGANDTIFFTAAPGSGLWSVPANAGTPRAVTSLEEGERTHRFPDFLPDARSVLFTARTGTQPTFDEATINRLSLETGEREVVVEGGSQARFLDTGHLVFARGGALHAVALDPTRLLPESEAVAVLDGVMTDPSSGAAHYSVSANGVLAYVPGGEWVPSRQLQVIGPDGSSRALPIAGRPFRSPRFSPDGLLLAVVTEAANDDVWIFDLRDGSPRRFTFAAGSNVAPVWSPDGSQLAFTSNRFGVYNLFLKAADLSGEARRLTTSDQIQFASSWHPDGSRIAFTQSSSETGNDIWTIGVDSAEPEPYLDGPHNEYGGVFSPDGDWMAYVSDENGSDEVFVQRYPGGGEQRQISSDGGVHPRWSRDGSRLFYRRGADIMSVAITRVPEFRSASPEPYLHIPEDAAGIAAVSNFDIEPGGSRFVIVREEDLEPPTRIHVVLNWFEELKAQVGN